MSSRRSAAPLVALESLLHKRNINDCALLVSRGRVLVNGVPANNPATRVRSDAAIRIAPPPRGARKLAPQLADTSADGAIALDLGASTGGFTEALLDAGAARVYAVDAGHGQLLAWLRADSRVCNLERTNLAELDPHLVPEQVRLVTIDLSYLSIADAVRQLDYRILAPQAELIALVKPTFELRSGTLAASPDDVALAVDRAARALAEHGWEVLGRRPSPIRGSHGAIEVFLHAMALPHR
jgi:23S rRNA (cytidine1920-2'-O)/16S rRNA (cytidine1409-2'-O)-methyltransferase